MTGPSSRGRGMGLRPGRDAEPMVRLVPDPLDRRRFLAWMLRTGAVALVPALPGRARAGLVGGRRAGAGEAPGAVVAGGAGGEAGAVLEETARAWRSMGTLIEVRVPDLPPAAAVAAIGAVRRRVEALEAALTLYRPESPLVAFNRSAPGTWTEVPEALAEGADHAVRAYRRSGGLFDPTVVPAMRAWGLYDLRGARPTEQFWRRWRGRARAEAVEVDAAGRRLRRHDPRVEVDLGGVGKGMAVDAALSLLHAAGSRSALVNLGGSIGVLGPPPDAPEGWPVGIAHPRAPGRIWTTLALDAGHLATSGDYERRVETPRGACHHLLDPESGYPTRGVASVTVRAPSGVEADLESTHRFLALARDAGPAAAGDALALLEGETGLVQTGSLSCTSREYSDEPPSLR